METDDTRRGPPRSIVPRLAVSLALMVAGLAVGAFTGVHMVDRIKQPYTVPIGRGHFTQRLESGQYLLYAPVGTSAVGNVTVTTPAGTGVAVTVFGGNDTLTRNGHTYDAAADFQAPVAGTYTIVVATHGPPALIVAQGLGTILISLAGYAIAVVVSLVVTLIGFALVIHTLVVGRRRRHQFPWQGPPWQGPPGQGPPWQGPPGQSPTGGAR